MFWSLGQTTTQRFLPAWRSGTLSLSVLLQTDTLVQFRASATEVIAPQIKLLALIYQAKIRS